MTTLDLTKDPILEVLLKRIIDSSSLISNHDRKLNEKIQNLKDVSVNLTSIDYELLKISIKELDSVLKSYELEKEGIKGITLLERLQLELDYFNETGKHLDIDNLTLCSGSRYSDGSVPYVDWVSSDSTMRVGWCYPDSRNDGLRSREIQE